jgi:hypothetical protein
LLQIGAQGAAQGSITALHQHHGKTDARQNVGHRARAVAAAPAVHQRRPGFGQLGRVRLDVVGDVAGDQRGAALIGHEGIDLGVKRADFGALGVVEHRPALGARHVIKRKF